MKRKSLAEQNKLTKKQWKTLLRIYYDRGCWNRQSQIKALERGGYILGRNVTRKGEEFLRSRGLIV